MLDLRLSWVMKSSIYLDTTPCRPVKVNLRFRGIYCLHLQGSACCLLHAGFILLLVFEPEDGGDVSPKHQISMTGLQGAISKKIELFN
jgi:hypothetical protein